MTLARSSSSVSWIVCVCTCCWFSTTAWAQSNPQTRTTSVPPQTAPAPAGSAASKSEQPSSGPAATATSSATAAGQAKPPSSKSTTSGSSASKPSTGKTASEKAGKSQDKAGRAATATGHTPAVEPPKPTVKQDSAAGGSSKASESARKLFSEAEQAFAVGDYRKAIVLFRQADEQAPRAELEYNIALAHEALSDKASALESYRAYLRRAPTSSDRTEVEANITRLAKDLGKLELQQLTVVTSPPGATILLDAQPRGFSPWTGEVPTGRHQLTARSIGYQDSTQNVSMGVDQAVEVNLVLEPDPAVLAAEQARLARARAEQAERDRPTVLQKIQPITWGLMGAGAAGLVGAGAFEQARANSEDDARVAATQLAAERELDSAESQQATARILLGVGAGAMVLGGVFLYIDLSREPESATQLTAGCAGRRCGLYARGNW